MNLFLLRKTRLACALYNSKDVIGGNKGSITFAVITGLYFCMFRKVGVDHVSALLTW